MLNNLRLPKASLVIAGLAAYAYYKYSKMSEEERNNMVSDLKQKGQKLYDDYVPENLKSMFGKKEEQGPESRFGEGNAYTS
jgi:hypothetical protein